MTLGGVVLTVNGDGAVVERQLAGGELSCPSCGGVLGGWGNAADAASGFLAGMTCGCARAGRGAGGAGDACAAAGAVPGAAG